MASASDLICPLFSSVLLLRAAFSQELKLRFDPQHYITTLGDSAKLQLWIDGYSQNNLSVSFPHLNSTFVEVSPNVIWISANSSWDRKRMLLDVQGTRPGRFILKATVEPTDSVDDRRLFVLLKFALSQPWIYISLLIGWIYAACWAIGNYPQIILNYKTKCVIGLSFDYLHINIVGHASYAIFNSFLYWNAHVEEEYFRRHPYGLNPVIGNDVGFAVHACFATGLTLVQCYIYENGGNCVSRMAKTIIGTYYGIILVSGAMVFVGSFHWLDFLYVLSYIKLSTVLIKYFPQAYVIYKRKTTEGFAIMTRVYDIAGGVFSVLQMLINAWNFDDWQSISGDPVKIGLGLFSIMFCMIFIVQHYILYRPSKVRQVPAHDINYHLAAEK
ncbi:cystinosin homolog [Uranotaenia lowii]|uniref:cystinosin homolog n=1 Tax=Uranotaenia lowii TaxID=190385 RepID=UPI00247A3C3F|nr:cystinosin homolog [Uranotaenia lowii]